MIVASSECGGSIHRGKVKRRDSKSSEKKRAEIREGIVPSIPGESGAEERFERFGEEECAYVAEK
jgi:hypothetical protein